MSRDPYAIFGEWFAEAGRTEPEDPNAMALATVDTAGRPSVRMVLLKGYDDRGFVFFTNLESRKGRDLESNREAALCLHWKSLRRQVRVEGPAEPVTAADADAYFRSRPRASQIGAWASAQSRPLEGRWQLERRVAEFTVKFNVGPVPRPPHWSGFRVVPRRIEFWRDRPFRLHERLIFVRDAPAAPWQTHRLFP